LVCVWKEGILLKWERMIQTHLNIVDKIYKLLPINKIIIEAASSDIQKIKNHNIQGGEYQQGEQFQFLLS